MAGLRGGAFEVGAHSIGPLAWDFDVHPVAGYGEVIQPLQPWRTQEATPALYALEQSVRAAAFRTLPYNGTMCGGRSLRGQLLYWVEPKLDGYESQAETISTDTDEDNSAARQLLASTICGGPRRTSAEAEEQAAAVPQCMPEATGDTWSQEGDPTCLEADKTGTSIVAQNRAIPEDDPGAGPPAEDLPVDRGTPKEAGDKPQRGSASGLASSSSVGGTHCDAGGGGSQPRRLTNSDP